MNEGPLATGLDEAISGLSSRDSSERCRAALHLGMMGRDAAASVPALVSAMGDEAVGVRACAACALGQIGEVQATQALVDALNDDDAAVRCEAGRALRNVGGAVLAVPSLILALKDENHIVRSLAAEALARTGDGSAVPALLQALEDPEELVRKNAAFAMAWDVPNAAKLSALALVVGELRDECSQLRQAALRAVRRVGTIAEVLDRVLAPRHGPKPSVDERRAAAEALGVIAEIVSVDVLSGIHAALLSAPARDRDDETKAACLTAGQALMALGDARLTLEAALIDDDAGVRGAAAEALSGLAAR
jgi:HEAT repeat protein